MISIVITSYKEPGTIGKAVKSFLNQKIKDKFELVVSAPDKETLEAARKAGKGKIKTFQDPGKGKTLALNMIIPKLKGEIIVLTDGDVFVSKNSVNQLIKPFEDKKVGCTTGRPVSINLRNSMFGYWSHLLCDAAHELRLKREKNSEFLECSGYLWAFRNNVISKIPRETAEDTIVPCLFYIQGYKIRYTPSAEVYVKFPTRITEFIEQKKRTAKGHETLGRYVDLKKIPRMKTMKNEILESYRLIKYPKNIQEYLWTVLLFPVRLYIWFLTFYHIHVKRNLYVDGWKPVKSTK